MLRLLPSTVFPLLGAYFFLVLPRLQDNSATTLDAFLLWPAASLLLLVLVASGLASVTARTLHRRTTRPSATSAADRLKDH